MTGNAVTKKYMSNNEKFADVFNYVLYNGCSVIRPEELIDCDPNELLVMENEREKTIVKDKIRDIKKSWILKKDNSAVYMMLGIENQTNIHYAMPVRNMIYDAVEYENQIRAYRDKHKRVGDLKDGEFLSGISKEDKLVPVITLVVYWGTNKWDGPKTLYDMFDIKDKRILQYINDYKLNLLQPAVIEDTEKFKSDFKYVVDFIKNSKDKRRLKQLMEENNTYFSKVPYDTAMLIKYCAEIDVRVKVKKEETNMCKAIDDMMEDAREEGRREKEKEMCKAIEDMKADAREEGRREKEKEMCKAIEDMKADAREEGRREKEKEMRKAIEDMKADAREEGRREKEKEIRKAIEDMKADAREEGRREKEKEIRKQIEDERKNIEIATSIEMIIRLNQRGVLSEENSAQELNMSLEEYRKCVEAHV